MLDIGEKELNKLDSYGVNLEILEQGILGADFDDLAFEDFERLLD